jgi:hypothetical protein
VRARSKRRAGQLDRGALPQPARDTLVLYSLDGDGDRCITKMLDRGVFLLPVPAAGQKDVVLDASKIGIRL